MAPVRTEWLSDEELPQLDAHLAQLQRFTDALADGVIDSSELAGQEAALVAAMKAVEAKLDDEQHALVTTLLVELTAYNIMSTLHGLTAERLGEKFGA
ncbi:MAG: hypothetical protein EP329_05225 [Deltaproteobacteria bacterium]|nr:MAG: hypothetical protein EP329_05225 [Deltaproteobacteria bacterium]